MPQKQIAGPGNTKAQCKITIITRFKSYPHGDKKRGYTVTGRTDMSLTKPEPNTAKGIRTTVAKQKQQEV